MRGDDPQAGARGTRAQRAWVAALLVEGALSPNLAGRPDSSRGGGVDRGKLCAAFKAQAPAGCFSTDDAGQKSSPGSDSCKNKVNPASIP